jgi:hypothetical protein
VRALREEAGLLSGRWGHSVVSLRYFNVLGRTQTCNL